MNATKKRIGKNAVVFSEAEINTLYGDLVHVHRAVKANSRSVAQELGRVIEQLLKKKVRSVTYIQTR